MNFSMVMLAQHTVVVDVDQVAVATQQMKMKKMNVVVVVMAIIMVRVNVAAANTIKMVADVVDHTNYIAKSRASLEALKSANLLKSVAINALIYGESGVGKKTLAKHILTTAPVADGNVLGDVLALLEGNRHLIIANFDKISNYHKLKLALDTHKTRIIATSTHPINEPLVDEFFSLKIAIPPLRERKEDVNPLVAKFIGEVYSVFGEEYAQEKILPEMIVADLSTNAYSLKRCVYSTYLMHALGEKDVLAMMEHFLSQRIGGQNDYRELLYLFDIPMIRSGHKKFGSQLAMSEKFGLNRNTLRKKINDYKDQLDLDHV